MLELANEDIRLNQQVQVGDAIRLLSPSRQKSVLLTVNGAGKVLANGVELGLPPAPPAISYHDAVLADNPAQYFPMELSALTNATTLEDIIGGNNASKIGNGTVTDRISLVSSLIAGEISAIAVVNPTCFSTAFSNLGTAGAVEFWYKGPASGLGTVLKRGGYNAGIFDISLQSDGSLYVDNGMNTGPLGDGARHHVVASFDADHARLYVDGVLHVTSSAYPLAASNDGTHLFGQNGYNGQAYNSASAGVTLDGVAIYAHGLSADRVAAHYAAGRG